MKFVRLVGSNGEAVHIDLEAVIAVRATAGETQVHLAGGQTVSLCAQSRLTFAQTFDAHIHRKEGRPTKAPALRQSGCEAQVS